MVKIFQEDQMTLLKIKSLLNHLDYFIKDEHKEFIDKFHTLCRKYCSYGELKK